LSRAREEAPPGDAPGRRLGESDRQKRLEEAESPEGREKAGVRQLKNRRGDDERNKSLKPDVDIRQESPKIGIEEAMDNRKMLRNNDLLVGGERLEIYRRVASELLEVLASRAKKGIRALVNEDTVVLTNGEVVAKVGVRQKQRKIVGTVRARHRRGIVKV
jgi:hypothetical protein